MCIPLKHSQKGVAFAQGAPCTESIADFIDASSENPPKWCATKGQILIFARLEVWTVQADYFRKKSMYVKLDMGP